MNRATFQEISKLRTREAETLLAGGQFPGAYYLMGYAVECALKACVAKQVRRYDFPNKDLANKVYTHDLEQLMKSSGLEPEFNQEKKMNKRLENNWTVVKDWSESKRYEIAITAIQARDLYSACTERRHGILNWIKRRW